MPNNNKSENEVKIISSATISFLTIATFPFFVSETYLCP